MDNTNHRHLVLELHDGATVATIACLPDPVPYRHRLHTLLAAMTTCPECQAVQAARCAVIDADPQWA